MKICGDFLTLFWAKHEGFKYRVPGKDFSPSCFAPTIDLPVMKQQGFVKKEDVTNLENLLKAL